MSIGIAFHYRIDVEQLGYLRSRRPMLSFECITEPREITRKALIFARSVVSSSVIRSAKYS